MIVPDIKIYVRTVDFMNIIKANKSVRLPNICFQFLIKIPITSFKQGTSKDVVM